MFDKARAEKKALKAATQLAMARETLWTYSSDDAREARDYLMSKLERMGPQRKLTKTQQGAASQMREAAVSLNRVRPQPVSMMAVTEMKTAVRVAGETWDQEVENFGQFLVWQRSVSPVAPSAVVLVTPRWLGDLSRATGGAPTDHAFLLGLRSKVSASQLLSAFPAAPLASIPKTPDTATVFAWAQAQSDLGQTLNSIGLEAGHSLESVSR